MHCYKFLFIALFVFLSSIATAQDTHLLRNKFQMDHETFFDVTLGMEGTSRSEGTERETSNTTYVLFGFKTDTVTESGKANISFKIYDMDYENPLTTGTKPDMKKLLGLSDKTLQMTLDDRGGVVHSPNLGKGNQLTEQIPWLVCPEKAVAIGDSWEQQREVPLTGASKPIVAKTNYTLASVGDEDGKKIAVITYETKIDEKDIEVNPFANQPAGGANLVLKFKFKNYNYSGKGTIRFDLDGGHILSKDETGTMVQEQESDMSMDGASFPSHVTNAYTLTTKAVYSDTKPTKPEPSESSDESESE
jgi:hypothetical protein